MRKIYEVARYGFANTEGEKELLRVNDIISSIENLEEKRIANVDFCNGLRVILETDKLILPAVSDTNDFVAIEFDCLPNGSTHKPYFDEEKGFFIEIE